MERKKEIREAIAQERFDNWLELVFLPLYGKETGKDRSRFAEQVIRFEVDLFHHKKISVRLLAATVVMSNKLIDKELLHELWEELKMLDILEVAKEKGIE